MSVTNKELENIREEQEKFMPDRATVKRREGFPDNETEYFPIAEDRPARFSPGFGTWRTVADRFQGITPFTATLRWDEDVRAGDLLVDQNQRGFEVRDVKTPSSYKTATQCLCDLVTDA